MRNSQLFQVSNPGPRVFPLFSDKAPQSTDDPDLQGFEYMPRFRQAVMVPPSNEVLIPFLDYPVEAFPTVAIRQFPDSGLEARYCLSVNPDVNHMGVPIKQVALGC
jgi:hypothetical protein